MNKTIIFFGAESDIAKSTMQDFTYDNYSIILVARKFNNPNWFVENLNHNYFLIEGELNSIGVIEEIAKTIKQDNLHVLNIVISYGFLGNNKLEDENIYKIIETNYISKVKLIKNILEVLKLDNAHITLFGSVAADRGRGTNLIYGSSTSGIQTFFQGLVNYKKSLNTKLLIIKFGPIKTKMTSKLNKSFLMVNTDSINKKVYNLIRKNKTGEVYLPFFWRYIMFLIKLIPDFIFRKIKF